RWLARFAPDARVAAVGLLEVDPDEPAEATPPGDLPFDSVWWTPRLDLEDPCEKFCESLERIRTRWRLTPWAGSPGSAPPRRDTARRGSRSPRARSGARSSSRRSARRD